MNIALEQTEEYANGQVSQISCTYFILINALMFALLSSLSTKLSFTFRLISFTYLEAFNMAGIVLFLWNDLWMFFGSVELGKRVKGSH